MSGAQLARELRAVERLARDAALDGDAAALAEYARELRALRGRLAKADDAA
jgi:hypothetical protein